MVISKFLIQIKAVKPDLILYQRAWPISIQNGKGKKPLLVTMLADPAILPMKGCREENLTRHPTDPFLVFSFFWYVS